MVLSLPIPISSLSSSSNLCGSELLSLSSNFSTLSISSKSSLILFPKQPLRTTIRMGGGPRTYPGGVSKWQWKRMQAKKAAQLLKARLARERQIYEMRKRAELKAAVTDLERPWEVVEKAPKLFSVGADEQVKVLADRFQKPGGFDMWSEKDGPQIFSPVNGSPTARFFPKGVVHSIKPYGMIESDDGMGNEINQSPRQSNSLNGDMNSKGRRYEKKGRRTRSETKELKSNNMKGLSSSVGGVEQRGSGDTLSPANCDRGGRKQSAKPSKVYDLSLQQDGRYEFKAQNLKSG
ncbi:uncharacterized protein LOC124920522 [Impatiens glandulifera]|uniref:uncharacterized protein LOC124920522 n=1 Tax=Impatiens glandulifera TaxID=253017 RepID=UPI001FB17A89|nr:uncharacterized protein LOC124920522 [Impatiens glandulifera]XP_047316978.1 uncharacterized protein LOC124920522 [Impatiens glandulifera]